MNYIFNGKHHNGNYYNICINANSLDDAWLIIAIDYREFVFVKFVCVENDH